MPNAVVHFEIPCDDAETLSQFYSRLFDWKFEKAGADMDYWFIMTSPVDDKGMPTQPGTINGGMGKRMAPDQRPMNYVEVDNVDSYVAKAAELGAMVAMGRTEVPGMGYFAQLVDPDGNMFGVWQNAPQA